MVLGRLRCAGSCALSSWRQCICNAAALLRLCDKLLLLSQVVTGIFVDSAVTTRTEDEVVDAFKERDGAV